MISLKRAGCGPSIVRRPTSGRRRGCGCPGTSPGTGIGIGAGGIGGAGRAAGVTGGVGTSPSRMPRMRLKVPYCWKVNMSAWGLRADAAMRLPWPVDVSPRVAHGGEVDVAIAYEVGGEEVDGDDVVPGDIRGVVAVELAAAGALDVDSVLVHGDGGQVALGRVRQQPRWRDLRARRGAPPAKPGRPGGGSHPAGCRRS